MKVFFYALFFHLLLMPYVLFRAWHIIHSVRGRILLCAIFGIEMVIYLAGLTFQPLLSDASICYIAFVGTTWMLFLMYMTFALIFFDLIFLFFRRRKNRSLFYKKKRMRYRTITFVVSLIFVICLLVKGNYNYRHPSVEEYNLSIDKSGGEFSSIRVAVVSDTHFGYIVNKSEVKRFVSFIMEQKPDLILFPGDIIDAGIAPLLSQRMNEDLRLLSAPLGVYGCPGNHEYRFGIEDNLRWLNDAGITMLSDSVCEIANSIYVVGRDDAMIESRKPIVKILEDCKVDQKKPIIVMSHTPINLSDEEKAGADVALYGHTHRGQFFPANIVTDIMYELSHGYKIKGKTNVFVTSGLGLAGPQYRIGSKSEILMINIKFSDN